MKRWIETASQITDYQLTALRNTDLVQVRQMIEILIQAKADKKKILVVGAGRSGLVGKAFAMRLMHIGYEVYVIGETITPAIGQGDLVIVVSGSGSGELSITAAQIAKKLGSSVIAITSYPDSLLGRIANHVVEIPGREIIAHEKEYLSRQLLGEHESLTPMGTLFELTCAVFLDCMIVELMSLLDVPERAMKQKHSTIE